MARAGQLHLHVGTRDKEVSGSLNVQIWQLVQSSSTKVENLEHDFNEIVVKFREMGWSDGERVTRCWVEKREENTQGGITAAGAVHAVVRRFFLPQSQSVKSSFLSFGEHCRFGLRLDLLQGHAEVVHESLTA